MKKILILFLMLGCAGCDILTNGSEIIERNTSVHDVIIESKDGGELSLVAKTGWYNGCGRFSHFFSYEKGQNIFFEIYCSQPQKATCTESPISINAPIRVKTGLKGEVNLKFMADGYSTFDTLITLSY